MIGDYIRFVDIGGIVDHHFKLSFHICMVTILPFIINSSFGNMSVQQIMI